RAHIARLRGQTPRNWRLRANRRRLLRIFPPPTPTIPQLRAARRFSPEPDCPVLSGVPLALLDVSKLLGVLARSVHVAAARRTDRPRPVSDVLPHGALFGNRERRGFLPAVQLDGIHCRERRL